MTAMSFRIPALAGALVLLVGWDASAGDLTDAERLDTSGTAGTPAIASDPRGNGTAAWLQVAPGGGAFQVAASRYTAGDGWSGVETLATGAVTSQPRVAMDSQGNAVVVWREGPDIWAAEFE